MKLIKRIVNKNRYLKRLYYIRDNYSEVDYDYIKSEVKDITKNFTSEEKEMLYGTLPIIVDRLISYLENYYITIGKGYKMNNKYISKVNKFCSKFNIKFYFEELGENYKTINWKLTLNKDEFNKVYELKYINDNIVQDLIKDYINEYYHVKLRTD